MKYKLETINKWLLVIMIILQPVINIIRNMLISDIQILGFSLFEMLNVVLVMISTAITFYLYHNKKSFIKYLIFFIFFILYSVFHYINILNFNSNVYEKYNPNFLTETYYLYRTFIISLLLILNIYYSNIKKQTIIRTIEILSLIISLVIVVTNLFKVGLLSYGEGVSTLNLFDWFTFKSDGAFSYYAITSKGWFSSANQISSILFMILPIILYSAYRKRCIFNYLILILHTLAMFMLGTKVANLGVVLVYLFFIIFYCILKLLKRTNHSIFPIIMIFISFCILFFYSPFYHNIIYSSSRASTFEKIENNNTIYDKSDKEILKGYNLFKDIKNYDCSDLNDKEKKNVVKLFEKYDSYLGISQYITDNYKVKKHTNYWCDYTSNYSYTDYRALKTGILKNIFEENNNYMDKYFGLGNSLNFIYTESDYSYQYYIYGILGVILFIGPYLIITLYLALSILKNFKTEFNLENCMYLLGPVLSLVVAYFSGHVLERNFPLLIISLLIGLNLINYKKESIEEKKIMFVSNDNNNLEKVIKAKKVLTNYDYRIITEKNNYTKSLKRKYGKKIDYLAFNKNDKYIKKIFNYIYNFFKCLYLYIKFNPKTVVVTSNNSVKLMCYISKIFGSKIVFVEPFVDSKNFSNFILNGEYILNLDHSENKRNTEKIMYMEDKLELIVTSPKKEKNKNYRMRFTLFCFLLFLMIFLFSPLTGDDWGNYINGTGKSFIDSILYAKKCFLDYEGRFFSRILLIYLTPKKFLCSLVSSCFISTIYYLITKLFDKNNNKNVYPLILISLLLIDVESFNQSYQWIAGRITYLFPSLFIFLILYIDQKSKFKLNKFKFILLTILTFIFSMFVETISCGIIITYIGLVVYYFYKTKKINWNLIILMIISIIGTIIMRYSPGSLARLNNYQEFDNLSIIGKIMYNFTNLIKYTLINNSFILFLLSIILTIFIKKNIKNTILKYVFIMYVLIIPVSTGVVYYLHSLNINIFHQLLNLQHPIIKIYWIIFSIISLIFLLNYLFKQNNHLMTILFISSIGTNLCMLISPLWGGRTSLFTDIGFSIVLIYILSNSINLDRFKKGCSIVLSILFVLIIFFTYGYFKLYKDNLKREQIISQQLTSTDVKTVDIYMLSERFAWNPNPYGEGYLYKTIKLYYRIPEKFKLNLVDRGSYENIEETKQK